VIRAVIDTNVVVSGLISPVGNEALILLAVHPLSPILQQRPLPIRATRSFCNAQQLRWPITL
jgi:hypothetical protein